MADAGITPTLSVSGETLNWTGKPKTYLVESKPANPQTFIEVATTSYKPPAKPGVTVEYRVRPKASPNHWSNAVKISYADTQKEQEEREAKEREERERKEREAKEQKEREEREAREQKEREEREQKEIEEKEQPKGTAGEVKYRLNAKSAYDQYAGNTAFLKAHIDRILGYGAFAWSHYVPTGIPNVCYLDAYTHWGAHSLNPTHRAEYVTEAKREIEHGCAGIFNDDIEWEGSGQHEVGTDAEVLALIEAVRKAIGTNHINQINTQWVDLWPRLKANDPEVIKSLQFIDHNDKEYGVNSASGINSTSSFADYLAYVDYLHAHNIHIDQADSTPGNVYEVATELLNNDGGDYIGSFVTPETWSTLYDTNLGAAITGREHLGSIYRRKFVGGTVYVNPPGGTTQTLDGHTLSARQGLIG